MLRSLLHRWERDWQVQIRARPPCHAQWLPRILRETLVAHVARAAVVDLPDQLLDHAQHGDDAVARLQRWLISRRLWKSTERPRTRLHHGASAKYSPALLNA